jgi:hypothetical protein
VWTTISTDNTSPYSISWNTTAVADGLYDLRVVTTDNVGNTFTSSLVTNVRVDNTNPTGAITAPANGANVAVVATTVSANSADPGSGVASAVFQRSPAGTGTWTTIATDMSSPYSITWDTTAVADGLYDLRVVTTDNVGNTFNSPTIANVKVDNTAPAGSLTAPSSGANVSGAAVSLSSNSADAGSGVSSASFQRSLAGAGAWIAISTDVTSPYAISWDTTAVADGLYDLRVVTSDNVGIATNSAAVTNVRVDNTAPTTAVSLSSVAPFGSAFLSGNTVYYRGTGGGAGGSFQISDAVSDAGSGPASATFPALGGTSTGWAHTAQTVSVPSGGPFVSTNAFTWSEGTSSSPTEGVQGADSAGNSATTSLTFSNDSTNPTGSITFRLYAPGVIFNQLKL